MPDRWEIACEPDDGFSVESGRAWSGYRLRYRPLGDRGRYRSVLVETEPNHLVRFPPEEAREIEPAAVAGKTE